MADLKNAGNKVMVTDELFVAGFRDVSKDRISQM